MIKFINKEYYTKSKKNSERLLNKTFKYINLKGKQCVEVLELK